MSGSAGGATVERIIVSFEGNAAAAADAAANSLNKAADSSERFGKGATVVDTQWRNASATMAQVERVTSGQAVAAAAAEKAWRTYSSRVETVTRVFKEQGKSTEELADKIRLLGVVRDADIEKGKSQGAKIEANFKSISKVTEDSGKQQVVTAGQQRFAYQQLAVQTSQFFSSIQAGQPFMQSFIAQGHQVVDVALTTGVGLQGAKKAWDGLNQAIGTTLSLGLVGVVATLAVGITAIAVSAIKSSGTARELATDLQSVGRNAQGAQAQLEGYAKALMSTQGSSRADATSIAGALGRGNLSGAQNQQVISLVGDVSTATGMSQTEAAKALADAAAGSYDAVEKLNNSIKALDYEQLKNVKTMAEQGRGAEAAGNALNIMKNQIDGVRLTSIGTLGKTFEDLGIAWSKFAESVVNSKAVTAYFEYLGFLARTSAAILNVATKSMSNDVDGLNSEIGRLQEKLKELEGSGTGGAVAARNKTILSDQISVLQKQADEIKKQTGSSSIATGTPEQQAARDLKAQNDEETRRKTIIDQVTKSKTDELRVLQTELPLRDSARAAIEAESLALGKILGEGDKLTIQNRLMATAIATATDAIRQQTQALNEGAANSNFAGLMASGTLSNAEQARRLAGARAAQEVGKNGNISAQDASDYIDAAKRAAGAAVIADEAKAVDTLRKAQEDEMRVAKAGSLSRARVSAETAVSAQFRKSETDATVVNTLAKNAGNIAMQQEATARSEEVRALQRSAQGSLLLADATSRGGAEAIKAQAAIEAHEKAAISAGASESQFAKAILSRITAQAAASGAEQVRNLKDEVEAAQRLNAALTPSAQHTAELNNQVIELTKNLQFAADATADPATRERLLQEIESIKTLVFNRDAELRSIQAKNELLQDSQALEYMRKEQELMSVSAKQRAGELAALKEIQRLEGRGSNRNNLNDQERQLVNNKRLNAELTQEYDNQKASVQALQDVATNAFDKVGDAITTAFVNGNGAAVNFGNITKGIISAILQDMLKLAVINPILNSVFSTGQMRPTLQAATGGGGSYGGAGGGIGATTVMDAGRIFQANSGTISPYIDNLAIRYAPEIFSPAPTLGATNAAIDAIGGGAFGPATPGAVAAQGYASSGLLNGGSALGGFASASNLLGIGGAALPGLVSGNYGQAAAGVVGAAIGTAILPGVGTIVGGMLGNFLGSALGPGPKNAYSSTGLGVEDGRLTVGRTVGQVFDTTDERNNTITQASQVNDAIKSLGLSVGGLAQAIQIGQNTPGGTNDPTKYADLVTPNSSGKTAFGQLRFSADDPELARVLYDKSFANPQELGAAIDRFNQVNDAAKTFLNDTAPSMLGANQQVLSQFRSINEQFKNAKDTAEQLKGSGQLSSAKIDEITEAEQKLDVARAKAINDAIEPLLQVDQATGSLAQSVKALTDQYQSAIETADALAKSQYVTAEQSAKLIASEGALAQARDAAIAKAYQQAVESVQQAQGGFQLRQVNAQAANAGGGAQIGAQLAAFDLQASQERRSFDAQLTGLFGDAYRGTEGYLGQINSLEQAQGAERANIVESYLRKMQQFEQQISDTVGGNNTRYVTAVNANDNDPSRQLSSQLYGFDTQAGQQIRSFADQLASGYGDAYRFTQDYAEKMSSLEHALGAERTSIVLGYLKRMNQLAKETFRDVENLDVRYVQAQAQVNGSPGAQQSAATYSFDVEARQQREQYADQLTDAYGDAYRYSADFADKMARLERTLGQERLAIVTESTQRAMESATSIVQNLTQYLRGLENSDANPLSPQDQYEQASKKFNAVQGAATAGDLNSIQQITGYANTFLQASKAMYGSGEMYARDYEQVFNAISGIANMSPDTLTNAVMQSEFRSQTATLVDEFTMLREAVNSVKEALTTQSNKPARAP